MVEIQTLREYSGTGAGLATSLGWSVNDLKIREIERGGTRLQVARGLVGGQPAALFASVLARNGHDPLGSAAAYGYHTTVDWGLLADEDGLTIFNSHRLVEDDWFRLPRIGWKELENNVAVLQALSPEGLIKGKIEKIAADFGEPTRLLRPVDDRLRAPKLLIRDLAQQMSFAVDDSGTTFLVGGTSVVPNQIELLRPLLAYLNSGPINALVRKTTPQFRGNFQKFEPQHLQGIPVLDRLVNDPDFSERLGALANSVVNAYARQEQSEALKTEGEIDSLIRSAAREKGIELGE